MPLTEKPKADIIAQIKRIVTEKHINVVNPNQDYKAWAAAFDDKAPSLMLAHEQNFERGVRELLVSLGSSHTGFYRQNGGIPAPHSIHATLSAIKKDDGKDAWMFLDIVEDGGAFQAGVRPGDLLIAVDGTTVVPPTPPFLDWERDID